MADERAHLAQADRHIEEAKARIARQRELVTVTAVTPVTSRHNTLGGVTVGYGWRRETKDTRRYSPGRRIV
jgi:hypothetical protein